MFRILLISHGKLAAELLRTAEMIVGEQPPEVYAISLPHGQDMDKYQTRIEGAVADAGEDGVLILTDIMGGSPFMTAARAYDKLSYQVPMQMVTGMNLPMVIEVLSTHAKSTLEEAAQTALQDGTGGIKDFVARLATKQRVKEGV